VPSIIRDLPFFDQATRVQVRGRSFFVKRDQIIVWVSIAEQGMLRLDPRVPCFPAILDSGCNYNLLINEQHLTAWAGIQPGYLRQLARMRVAGEPSATLASDHPRQARQVLDRLYGLETPVAVEQLLDGRFDHRADFQQQPAART